MSTSNASDLHSAHNMHSGMKDEPFDELRDYQQECIDACVKALKENKTRIAVSMPTDAGKIAIFLHLIGLVVAHNGQGNRVMIVVDRIAKVEEIEAVAKTIYRGKSIGVEMSKRHAEDSDEIVIATRQTLAKGILNNFDPKEFKLLIVVDDHHAVAPTWVNVINFFNNTNTSVPVLGFFSGEEKKKGSSVFDEIVLHMDLRTLIDKNHLIDPKFTEMRMKGAESTTDGAEFSSPMKTLASNELIYETYRRFKSKANVKSTLLYGVDIEHIRDLCALFQFKEVTAEYVTHKISKRDRSRIVDRFKAGKVSVLMTSGVLTEGISNIDCIMLAKPTRSKTRLIKMIECGLRRHEGKVCCQVIDFTNLEGSHLISSPSLDGDAVIKPDVSTEDDVILETRGDDGSDPHSRSFVVKSEPDEDLDVDIKALLRLINGLPEGVAGREEGSRRRKLLRRGGGENVTFEDIVLLSFATFADFLSGYPFIQLK